MWLNTFSLWQNSYQASSSATQESGLVESLRMKMSNLSLSPVCTRECQVAAMPAMYLRVSSLYTGKRMAVRVVSGMFTASHPRVGVKRSTLWESTQQPATHIQKPMEIHPNRMANSTAVMILTASMPCCGRMLYMRYAPMTAGTRISVMSRVRRRPATRSHSSCWRCLSALSFQEARAAMPEGRKMRNSLLSVFLKMLSHGVRSSSSASMELRVMPGADTRCGASSPGMSSRPFSARMAWRQARASW